MHDNATPRASGDAASGCGCGARAIPAAGVGEFEQHADDCGLLDASRERRARDRADLAAMLAGTPIVRRLDATEVGDLAAAVGRVATARAELRRWRVRCAAVERGGSVHLGRTFLRDGVPRGGLIDSAPVVAGAAR